MGSKDIKWLDRYVDDIGTLAVYLEGIAYTYYSQFNLTGIISLYRRYRDYVLHERGIMDEFLFPFFMLTLLSMMILEKPVQEENEKEIKEIIDCSFDPGMFWVSPEVKLMLLIAEENDDTRTEYIKIKLVEWIRKFEDVGGRGKNEAGIIRRTMKKLWDDTKETDTKSNSSFDTA